MAKEYVPYDGPVVTRADAKRDGLKRYFTGKACPKGHIAERMISSVACRACGVARKVAWEYEQRAPGRLRRLEREALRRTPEAITAKAEREKRARAEYYLKNKEQIVLNNAAWYAENRERKLKKGSEWHAANRESVSARKTIYSTNNPEIRRASKLRRRAREAGERISADDLKEIRKAQRNKCAYCKEKLKSDFHVDHIMPLALGGANDRSNLQLTCQLCNLRKSKVHPITFAQRLGLLI